MIWLNWILSPVARWGAAIAFIFAFYVKARNDGKETLRREQENERNRRLRDAVEADTRARERIARGELLNDDGHKRD
jgi:hypothetical protein